MNDIKYFELEPEVAGGWGDNIQADTSIDPPRVTKLHYQFSGWLGDCIVESFPCFIITEAASQTISLANLTGYEFADVEVSLSEQFNELQPDCDLPEWRWIKITGIPGTNDFSMTNKSQLVVSDKALQILKEHSLEHCDISTHSEG